MALPRLFSRRDVPLERLWSWRRPAGPSLPAEGRSTVKVLPYQKLQGHHAAELRVLGLIDHTHAAATQLFQNAVVGNGLTNHGEGPASGLIRDSDCRHLRPQPRASQRAFDYLARKTVPAPRRRQGIAAPCLLPKPLPAIEPHPHLGGQPRDGQ